MIEDGNAIHYNAVERGTAVYGSDEVCVGEVVRVLDNARENILDGIVFRDAGDGEIRFADGPEVQRTAERGVTLTIDSAAARLLAPPESRSASDSVRSSRLGRLFGR